MNWLKRLFGCKEEVFQNELTILRGKILAAEETISALKKQAESQNPLKLEPITPVSTISLSEVYELLTPLCSEIHLSDEYYSTCTVEQAKEYSKQTAVQYRNYEANDHDCDNYSFAAVGYWSDGLKSFPFGIAWSKNHAFNIFIDDQKKIWIVEPQTNQYYTLEEAKSGSFGTLMYAPINLIVI